jgi:hypothetical protein
MPLLGCPSWPACQRGGQLPHLVPRTAAALPRPPHPPTPPAMCVQLPAGRPLSDALDYELQDMKKKMNGN